MVDVRRLRASNPLDRPAGDGPQSPLAMARRDGRHAGREPRVPVRLRLPGCSQHQRVHVKDPGRRAGKTRPCSAQGPRMSYPPAHRFHHGRVHPRLAQGLASAGERSPSSLATEPTPKVSTRGQKMTLIKSILLGSAAGIVAIAGAQAADLPTKKAAPVVQYVKICNVGGITGWTLPGSDTCVKLSGYITAQLVAGNLNTQYNWGTTAEAAALATGLSPGAASALAALSVDARTSQRVLVAASEGQGNSTFYRNAIGWSMSSSFGFDIASNTAYGPLIGHFDFEADLGNGLDPLNGSSSTDSAVFANEAYLTWAGITAGKAASFYSFTGGGDNWANFFSPDQKGFNEPIQIAYTASFGGGFSATIAAQSPGTNGFSGEGTQLTGSGGANFGALTGANPGSITYGGQRWPDIVGALHVRQGWGEAQVSGVIHDVDVSANGYTGAAALLGCGVGVGALPAVNCNSPGSARVAGKSNACDRAE